MGPKGLIFSLFLGKEAIQIVLWIFPIFVTYGGSGGGGGGAGVKLNTPLSPDATRGLPATGSHRIEAPPAPSWHTQTWLSMETGRCRRKKQVWASVRCP